MTCGGSPSFWAHLQVFLVSSGRMTSFSPRGQLNWMLDTAAEWASMDSSGHTVGPWRGKLWAPRPAHVPAGLPITPSLLPFSPYAYHGHQEELVLGVGGSAIVIVSGKAFWISGPLGPLRLC